MVIKYRDLRKASTTSPPLDALVGGELAVAHRLRSVHGQLDSVLGNDRNVVARVGLQGGAAFQIVSTDPVSMLQVYPLRTVYRSVARVPAFTLMPGHFLRLSALVEPAGMTSQLGGPLWTTDAAYGEISVSVTWGGPSADTTVHKVILPTSSEEFAGEDTTAGASWANLRRVEIPIMFPDAVTTSMADARLWSEGVTAAVTIQYRGGVRAVDVVLQQLPLAYARDVAADTVFSAAMTTNGVGELVQSYPVAYPVEERSATDPSHGAALAMSVAHQHQTKLGPVFAYWSGWDEATGVAETDVPSVTTTSTTFVDMLRPTVTAWASAAAGWSMSAGSQSQQFKSSNGLREMRGRNAVVPVRVWAYASRSGAVDAVLRFQSADHSVVEITVTSSTPGWYSTTGFLRCGATPTDPSVLQVLGRSGVITSTLSLSAILVEYVDL
jgi:hypothetical protein